MMQKVYEIENLCCANCGAKIEEKLNAIPGIEKAVLVFPTRQLRVTAENPDALLTEMIRIARTVESDVVFRPRSRQEHKNQDSREQFEPGTHPADCGCTHQGHHRLARQYQASSRQFEMGDVGGACACGHHHEDEECGHPHEHSHGGGWKEILAGGGLFGAGLVLSGLGLEWAGKAVFLLAYLILGREVILAAVKNFRKGRMLDENFLMSLATVGAFCINEFPEAVGVMLFYRVGEYFEEKAVARSRSQIMDAVDLRPEVVHLVQGTQVRVIPAAEAKPGDRLAVRPGDRIPLDGVVVGGESRIDTAPITGEPVPVHVGPGDDIISGCVNGEGQLIMEVRKPLSQSMVTRILDSVENAAASKPKIDRFITRFARIYTPIVVGLAVAVAVVPSVVTGDWNYWVYTALSFLVMSCPCALVLSVPLAFFSGIGVGSKRGILFKGGASMEAMSKVKAVIMDKTGTLTQGDFKVQNIVGDPAILPLCASCEQHSTHPIAMSIVAAARAEHCPLGHPEALEELPGRGIRATLAGKEILCGNEALLEQFGVDHPKDRGEFGTRVLVAVSGHYVGHLLISDTLKDGAKAAVKGLKTAGFTTVMLTGDSEDAAKAVADAVGVDRVYARLLPDQKLERLQAIRQELGAAMFVGDGINDAPVLAGADVGAAMGSGADAAIEAADVVFMTSHPEAISEALDIARRTNQVAWQNVVFALTIKAGAMVLGLLGYASMWMAVFADSGVAMLCVLNAIRMLYRKK